MKTQVILILALAGLLTACQQQTASETKSGTTISGVISGAEGRTVYFKRFDGKGDKDTINIADDGSFSVNVGKRPLDFYMLYFHKRSQLALILDSTQTDIRVTAEVDDVANTAKISGSPDSELMADFFNKQMTFNKRPFCTHSSNGNGKDEFRKGDDRTRQAAFFFSFSIEYCSDDYSFQSH